MGAFEISVRKGRVASPTQAQSTPERWTEEFTKTCGPDDYDRSLYVTGLWFFQELKRCRESAPSLGTLGVAEDELLRAALSSANRDWVIVEHAIKKMRQAAVAPIYREALMSQRLELPGITMDHDTGGIIEALVDALRHLAYAGPVSPNRVSIPELLNTLGHRAKVSSLYLWLENLWKDCLWGRWRVLATTTGYRIVPTDLRSVTAMTAARFREEKMTTDVAVRVEAQWRELNDASKLAYQSYRIPDSIVGSRRNRTISLRKFKSGEMPRSLTFGSRVGAWLYDIIQNPLPTMPELSIALLQRAWDVVVGLATAVRAKFPNSTAVNEWGTLWQYSPAFDASELRDMFGRALSVTTGTATSLLDILSISTLTKTDPWVAPFWCVAGKYYVIVPVALTANPVRLVDYWCECGGVELSQRGPLFENEVREMCQQGIATGPLAGYGNCLQSALKTDAEVGDIDLAVRIGTTLLIGELKCAFFPASAVEVANFLSTLEHAAAQILRKASFVRGNLRRISEQMGGPVDDVVVAVVSSQPMGVGQLVREVPVVDMTLLSTYLTGFYRVGVFTDAWTGHQTPGTKVRFYGSPTDAASNLRAYLRAPPQIASVLGWVRYREDPLAGDKSIMVGSCFVAFPSEIRPAQIDVSNSVCEEPNLGK